MMQVQSLIRLLMLFLIAAAAQRAYGSDSAFPLRVSESRRYLIDAKDTPFLIVGDTAWSLIAQLNKEEIAQYLDDRERRGFNAIIVSLIEHKFASRAPAKIDGVQPFLVPGDFTRPNPAYFEYAHWAVTEANKRGITVWLCPAYLGVHGGDEGFFQEIKAAGPPALRGYGRFVGERFKDLPNIVWMPGGDYAMPENERWAGNELAEGLREGGATQLMTAHGCQHSAIETFGEQPWLEVDNVYSYRPDLWSPLREAMQKRPVRPFVLIETLYEHEFAGTATPAEIRRQAWWSMLSGACGQFFGNNPIWHFDGPGYSKPKTTWQEALDGPGSRDHARLGAFFITQPWHQLLPDIEDKIVSAGGGDGVSKVTAARTADGSRALLYVPTDGNQPRELKLNLAGFPGPVTAQWFNPAKEAPITTHAASLSNKDAQSISTPGENDTGTNDWVLMLEAFGAPAGPQSGRSAMCRVPAPAGELEVKRKQLTDACVAVKTAEVMEARMFTEAGTSEKMPYRLFKISEPESAKKYPLVLLLHHATRGGDDNLRQVRDDPGVGIFCLPETQRQHPCYVLAPQAGGKDGEAWSNVTWTTLDPQSWPPEPNRNMQLALAILDSIVREFPVDTDRIYISGASMGSYGTHDAISRRPNFFAGAVTICGGYTPAAASRLTATPIWTFHGDADETIDVEQSRRLFAAVQAAGGKDMTYWEYAGVRHVPARDLAYANPAVLEWLFTQRR